MNSECPITVTEYIFITSFLPSLLPESLVSLVALAALVGLGQADDMHRFCSTVPNGRFVSNPRSCQHWIFCQNERATEGQCPGIFHFDVAMQMCRYPEFVQCDFDAVDVTCPISGLELLPHPTTCHQYVACVNGFPRVANCAPGLHWDQTRQICDLPENTPHCEVKHRIMKCPDLNVTLFPYLFLILYSAPRGSCGLYLPSQRDLRDPPPQQLPTIHHLREWQDGSE